MHTIAPAPLPLSGVSPKTLSLLTLCLYHRTLHDALIPNKALLDVDAAILALREQLGMGLFAKKDAYSKSGDNLVPALTRAQILESIAAQVPAEGALWLIVDLAGELNNADWVRAVQQGEYPVLLCAASGYDIFQHYHQPAHICFRIR